MFGCAAAAVFLFFAAFTLTGIIWAFLYADYQFAWVVWAGEGYLTGFVVWHFADILFGFRSDFK